MHTKIEAQVALCKCQEGRSIYGVRMEKTSLGWKYDWAFKISEGRAKSEGYNSADIKGMVYPAPEYPGCPYCKTKTFIVCGACGKLNCNNQTGNMFTCGWCGAQGVLTNYDGAGIRGAGDV